MPGLILHVKGKYSNQVLSKTADKIERTLFRSSAWSLRNEEEVEPFIVEVQKET
jgi:hypothetical protein